MLLAVIEKMDKEGVETDVERLAELGKFFKSHVEYMLENLLEEGLILIEEKKVKSRKDGDSPPESKSNRTTSSDDHESKAETLSQGTSATMTVELPHEKRLIDVHDFLVTRKGKALLEEKKKELAKLSVAMQRLYNRKNIDELYRTIFWNREWIALMLYTGVLTTDYLRTMMKLLGLDMNRLSMTETQEKLDGLGIDPGLLSMGLFIAHPLMAIVSYIISIVSLGKLEEKMQPEQVKKISKAPGRMEGDLYIPKID